jgi:hypothetical protein
MTEHDEGAVTRARPATLQLALSPVAAAAGRSHCYGSVWGFPVFDRSVL